jgi:hypothetical protein
VEDFHVQREALRTCASQFVAVGDACSQVSGTIGGLGIAAEVFTGPGEPMAAAYEKYRKQMYDVFAGCDKVLTNASTSLRGIADNYETVDDDVKTALSKGLKTN